MATLSYCIAADTQKLGLAGFTTQTHLKAGGAKLKLLRQLQHSDDATPGSYQHRDYGTYGTSLDG